MRAPFSFLAAVALSTAVLALPSVVPAEAAAAPATVVPVRITGEAAKRFNIVFVGDGYTKADLPTFRAHIDKHVNTLLTIEPFKSYRDYINVYAVEVESPVSGVSCDPNRDSPRRDTPLKMGFWSGCSGSTQRALLVDSQALTGYGDLVKGTSSANRQLVALANSTTYGGIGGSAATASGGNAMSALITPHELGHSLGGLDDEYDYYERGQRGARYSGGEPTSIHHTLLTEQQMRDQKKKWWRWLGEPSESGGTIGRYEAGLYSGTGVWRPSKHSMMKTLGYPFDQISRERMVERISSRTTILSDAIPAGTIGADRVVWVDPLHPNSHELTTTWKLDGAVLPTKGARDVDLAALSLKPGKHTLTATVSDPTDFVRDPAIRTGSSLTRTRTWTVDTTVRTTRTPTTPAFLRSTATDRPVGAQDVVYAEPAHPVDRTYRVSWSLNGKPVTPSTANDRDLDLKALNLPAGTHKLTASVGDGAQTLTWTVDATPPTTSHTLSDGVSPGVYKGPFDMRLTGRDDQPGTVITEFRTDGDGWFTYFGWPTDASAPWHFTPEGTVIDNLVYGKLGTPRLSPWDDATPSYGTHKIEYRSTDAAGNIGPVTSFEVTLVKP